MTSKTFVPGTVIDSPWLNDVNTDVYKGPQQALTGFFYSENGARVSRLADRVLVGDATKNLGTNVTVQPEWLTTYQLAKGRSNGFIQSTQMAVTNSSTTGDSSIAFIGASQTKFLYDNYNSIGILGVAVANRTTGIGNAYAGYYEGYREVGALGGAYGIEIDTVNYASVVNIDPYQQIGNQTVALQLASGGEYSGVGQFAASAAINIQKNGSTFSRGIIFGSDSLTGATGTTGTAPAIVMGKGHTIWWTSAAGVFTSSIVCNGTTAASAISENFADNAINYYNAAGKAVFQIAQYPNAVNYLSARGNGVGLPAQLFAQGDDANVDIQLATKGTGLIWLGGYAAGVLAPAGYLTVKDSAGTIRRLLVG